MYPSQRLHPWPLALATLSSPALAIGFGDITLTSRMGEPLHAEVAIVSGPRDTVETACFSLAPLRDSDLPVITSARLKLIKGGDGYRLLISGTAPLAEPAFILALRAACGTELRRDYVLIPAAPTGLEEAPAVTLTASQPLAAATAVDSTITTPPPDRNWAANQGAPLESIAPKRQVPRRSALPPPQVKAATTPRPRPKPQAAPPSSRPAAGGGGDRLTLGAPPADFKPGERPTQSQGAPSRGNTMAEMEERVQRMEKVLSLLNDEVAKLNQALALTSEVLAAQQKMQAIQANQIAQGAVREASLPVPAPLPAPLPTASNWGELLLCALGGGIIASLAVYGLGLRRKNAVDSELPLAMLASRSRKAAGSTLATETAASPEPGDKSQPVVELAEITLSSGSVHETSDNLAEHIAKEAPDQLTPWLALLDQYRRSNRRWEFETLATQIQSKFNIHVPAWDEEEMPASKPDALERHPHIVDYLTRTWGQQNCLDYLQTLLKDNRSGERHGFSRQEVEEIVFLSRVLENGYGLRPT